MKCKQPSSEPTSRQAAPGPAHVTPAARHTLPQLPVYRDVPAHVTPAPRLTLPQLPVYRDVGDDQENYVGFIGSSIGGPTRFTKSILGKQTLGDVCTLTRKVPATNVISAVDPGEIGWTEIEITIDSGACDTVMPTRLCSHISVIETEDSRRGMEYEVANGETYRTSARGIASS